ncbi:MAG TPA: ABC transporter permease [Euzebya sp.]|nr:ABC transporter permease [Euzebya sp.]
MLPRDATTALLRHNLLLARRDAAPLVVMVAMPLVLMAFLQPALRLSLQAEGYDQASGAEQTVPGMAVMFVLYMVGVVGFRIFEEHGWGTWNRLRASPAGAAAVLVGKIAPSFLVLTAQLTVLFGAGVVLYGLRIAGSVIALLLVGLAFAGMVLALGVLLAAVARTAQQLNVLSNIGTTVLAGIGGAIVPLGTLPEWAQSLAPATPSYWAMLGFRTVILEGGHVGDVIPPVVVLLVFAGVFAALAATRFRFDDTKTALV